MNEFKRLVLQRHETEIYNDVVDPQDISLHLQGKNILQVEDIEAISNSTARLIKVLLNKTAGPWFEEFVLALSKDFNWISDKIKHDFYEEHDQKITYYLSGRGNVPPLPQHNVTRTDYIQKLRKEMKDLKRQDFLVIHGMSGLGKTCLVIDALHDINLLEQSLEGCVYWMSVGDLRNDELDDLQCSQLQKKLCDMINLPINPQQDLLLQLKKYFSVKPNISALLVLDKVRSSKVVEVLNVGCKILVTTQDKDVVKNQTRKHFFPIDNGFSESESVQLLHDFVLNGPGDLPPRTRDCAMTIHRSWKGHPMVIGLIGGELSETKEESAKNHARWIEYERVSQGDNNSVIRRRSIVEERMSAIIELTTNKLPNNFKTRFDMLAVLVEDTNITSEILKILWGLDKSEVERTMDLFYRRSLVFRKFNDHLKMPVYGVHDILMEYLKKNISRSELQKMHKDLILKLYDACFHNFANLPRDSYIYSYLCHHIENADRWHEFRDQFFSLQYIESKLKATGPGDLLLDLHKYRTGLVGIQDEYVSKVEDVKNLVSDSGWDIHQGEVDIVQCALLQPQESFLHQQASVIANKSNSLKLYFNPNNTWERPKDLEAKIPNVKAACLVVNNAANHVDGRILMYPDQAGHIVELDMHYRNNRRSFKEQGLSVILKMSPLYDKFLSALDTGSISVWNLISESTSNADTPPPSLRQRSHQPFFQETRTTPSLSFKHERRVTCACFSNDGKLIASASEGGDVCVWNLEENKRNLKVSVHPSPPAMACTFLRGDTMIVYGGHDFQIFFYDLRVEESFELTIDRNNGDLVSLLGANDEFRKLIVVQDKAVLLYSWTNEILGHRKMGPRNINLLGLDSRVLHREKHKVICAAYQKRRLLLGTQKGCLMLDVFNENIPPLRFGSGEVRTVDMANSRVLLVQKDSVKMHWPDSASKLSSVKQTISGHLGWIAGTYEPLSVYTTVTSDGNVQVYHDGRLVAERYCREACIARVGPDGDHILIGTIDGRVFQFDTVSKQLRTLPFEFSMPITYLSVTMYGSKRVCLATAKKACEGESYTLQAVGYENHRYIRCSTISAPVVKTFICSSKHCLISILSDYSVLAWDLSQAGEPYPVQDGRISASITDANLTEEEDILVLSDKENCFHQVSLGWHQDEDNASDHRIPKENPIQWRNNRLAPTFLKVNPKPQSTDEVDGIGMSTVPNMPVKGSLNTHPLSSSSWCCCICTKGELLAIGHDDCKVLLWNLKTKTPITSFDILPNRRTKIGQLQFSPYEVKFGQNRFGIVLAVVTDCLSMWDLSPFIVDNAAYDLGTQPKCLGCVSAGGNPIIQLSTNETFQKFSAFDEFGSYFSWNVWEAKLVKSDK